MFPCWARTPRKTSSQIALAILGDEQNGHARQAGHGSTLCPDGPSPPGPVSDGTASVLRHTRTALSGHAHIWLKAVCIFSAQTATASCCACICRWRRFSTATRSAAGVIRNRRTEPANRQIAPGLSATRAAGRFGARRFPPGARMRAAQGRRGSPRGWWTPPASPRAGRPLQAARGDRSGRARGRAKIRTDASEWTRDWARQATTVPAALTRGASNSKTAGPAQRADAPENASKRSRHSSRSSAPER